MTHRPGSICLSMLNTREPDRAIAFYTRLIAWTAEQHGEATFFHRDGKIVAAVTDGDAEWWVPYVSVEDLDARIATALALGAEIGSRQELQGLARTATLRDPEGARFGLWQA